MTRQQAHDTWWLGVAVAAFAVISGQTVMVLGDAPPHAAWVQFIAISLAAATFPLMSLAAEQAMRWPLATLGLGVLAILLTLVVGAEADDVRRGAGGPGVAANLGYLAAPLALGVMARRPGAWSAAGLALLSLGFALQPDAAALIALTAALTVLVALDRDRWTAAALCAAALAAAWALSHPDPRPPIGWVEGMPQTALSMKLWLGFFVVLGLCLMPTPFVFIAVQGRRRRPLAAALAAYWVGLVGASFAGGFPTPLVGYGVGPILGYVLSWALLRVGAPSPSARQR